MKKTARFRIYFIDSGFNENSSALVRPAIERFRKFARNAEVFVLDEDLSTRLLRKFPLLIGKDPILVIEDRVARERLDPEGFGLHLQLGVVRHQERALWYMKIVLRALNDPEASENLTATMREAFRLEGVRGVYWSIMESVSDTFLHH